MPFRVPGTKPEHPGRLRMVVFTYGGIEACGLAVIDPGLNRGWTIPQLPFSGSTDLQIRSINLQTAATISTLTLPMVTGRPIRLIRWGTNGLAFNTEAGDLYILSGSFVN